ncbi:TetR family transcriptional regulator [Tsukamurella sp. 8F]|uniref:TetR/AcrR family transcriptional regulator n=1 Tax=unclassified Tsukamurella TaxID=2633480 RepID=UPI0023B98FC9|nr:MULTISPECIES: TetR family transcriptional regulator [unclassified Tsukamurella]MDF0528518.1 TetR family transcriptional regulator [Tsukamurella sp. 8J]MDF0586344.1 TetR family transcriptional regulator [Tsukamurella sp. 8F]
MASRSGRRAGASTAKDDILAAAQELFAADGYDRVSIRAIAGKAGVDVALVSYYFGNKRGLFIAAMSLPIDPGQVIGGAVRGDPGGRGERLVRTMLRVWDDPATADGIRAMFRSSAVDEAAAHAFGEFVATEMLPTVAREAGVPIATAQVVASTLYGLMFLRYIVAVPLYAQLTADEVVAQFAPAVQRIFEGG